MKRVDIVIVGAGKAGRAIADKLNTTDKKTALISLPGNPEDAFRTTLEILKTEAGPVLRSLGAGGDLSSSEAHPHFLNPHTLQLDGDTIEADRFILATGALPIARPEFHGQTTLTPLEAVASPPGSAAIIGTGPIAVATAVRIAKTGCKVTMSEPILSETETSVAEAVRNWMRELGIKFGDAAGTPVLATGFTPNTAGLALDKVGVLMGPEGQIVVDEQMRTSAGHIYAVGVVTGVQFNTALEDHQAEIAAENMTAPFFSKQRLFPEAIPYVLPLDPAVAGIGATEVDPKTQMITVSSGPWRISLIAKKKSAELAGVHVFAPGADALILYFDLLMRAGVTLRDVAEKHHFPSPGQSDLANQAVQAWLAQN